MANRIKDIAVTATTPAGDDYLVLDGATNGTRKIVAGNALSAVTSVAGRTGAVTLSTSDISGLGTIASQAASSVSITGGVISGLTSLGIASGTVTSSSPAFDVTQTWNGSGVTFTAATINVTDTASAAASKLLDLQVGGASKLAIDKTGALTIAGTYKLSAGGGSFLFDHDVGINGWLVVKTRSIQLEGANLGVQMGLVGAMDVAIARNAAGVLEINNVTLGTYRDLLLRNLTASGNISASGNVTVTGNLTTNSGSAASPAIRLNDTANGLFYTGSNVVRVAAGGSEVATVSSTAATFVGAISASNLSGTNTGDQTITLTGHVTGSGTGSFATTIANGVVTNAMLAGSIDLAAKVTGTLPVANGGTGQTTAQAAINALAGATTSGQFLRGDGTNVTMSAIQAADVPTLNQNTTGTAANVTGTVAVANGGTGATTLAANNVLLGNGTSAVQAVAPGSSGNVLTSNGTTWTSAAVPAGGLTYLFKTANYTAADKQGVLADTSGGAFTVTLPATPATGAQVVVADAGGAWGTNNLTVARNGSTITGLAEDFVCNISGASVQLVYDGTTWEAYAQVGGNGGTAVTLNGTQTLTNKTINGSNNTITNVSLTTGVTGTLPVANGGTGVTTSTGSGDNVLSTSPTLVTPILGTPTSGTLSNCTVDGTNAVGFRILPQNSQSAAYTAVLGDSGKHILHPSADTTARTFTIPANGSVAYPIGTALTFVNQNGAGTVTIAITTDTMRLAGAGTTGSRTLAANGVATAIKITSTEWIISGTGLT